MMAKFDKIIRKNLQIRKTDVVLLAVSGGIDSMVMADLWRSTHQMIVIAHCNFQLRGLESDLDQDLVKAYAVSNKIPIHIKKFDLDKSSGGIQEEARDLRYTWFNELILSHKYDYIATAHHMDDQLETFMINLIRGTGIEGLSGIPQHRNKIIRPLLSWGPKDDS